MWRFNSTRIGRRALSLLPIPVVLIIWQGFCALELFNPQLFPRPMLVFAGFVEMARNGELLYDMLASGRRALVGYMLGCALGVGVGTLTGRLRVAELCCSQVINVLRSFPPVALVPFAIIWFGLAESAKYFLVFWGVFFPVWVSTHAGMSTVERTLLWAAMSLGASRRQLVASVLLPAALPHILAGMRVAIGIAFICVFVAEMSGVYEGIGFRISTSYLVFRVDKMMAALFVLGIMGAIADWAFRLLTARLFPWTRLANHG